MIRGLDMGIRTSKDIDNDPDYLEEVLARSPHVSGHTLVYGNYYSTTFVYELRGYHYPEEDRIDRCGGKKHVLKGIEYRIARVDVELGFEDHICTPEGAPQLTEEQIRYFWEQIAKYEFREGERRFECIKERLFLLFHHWIDD